MPGPLGGGSAEGLFPPDPAEYLSCLWSPTPIWLLVEPQPGSSKAGQFS